MSRLQDIESFYQLLGELNNKVGGYRTLAQSNGKMNWPERGVYFFFEPGEYRKDTQNLRVVRVGTHAVSDGSKSKLWGRLRQHKGTNDGRGNHRGSIFRLHVGSAIIRQNNWESEYPHWELRSRKKISLESLKQETVIERLVSEHIGQMQFLWLKVDDESGKFSHRSVIEQNSIALLAGSNGESSIDPSSKSWQGKHSSREKIRLSGLWNLNYVGTPDDLIEYDPNFLHVFADHLHKM